MKLQGTEMTLNEYLDAPLAPGASVIEKARRVAEQAHRGQTRRNGDPYITHPVRIAQSFRGMSIGEVEDEQVVSYLHDVVEDTEITLGQLEEFGFSGEQVEAVDSVTKREGESYLDFVLRAKANPVGRQVKEADIKDNLSDNLRAGDPLLDKALKGGKHLREKYELALWILNAPDF